MKLNKQLLQINRNFIICFIASASLSAVAAQLLAGYENYQNTTITIIIGYIIYFGLFSSLFYMDNRKRYKTMESKLIKKELLKLISSFGIGEIIYLGVRDDIPVVMNSFDVFIGPALQEGFGLVAVEAQAAGVPCVLYNGFPKSVDMGFGLVKFLNNFEVSNWVLTIKDLPKKNFNLRLLVVNIFKSYSFYYGTSF